MVSRFRRSRPVGPPRFLALISAVATGIVLLRSAAAEQQQVFRCESEEDLDGSACRVDMLPDSALAEMVYERGFDAEGADRLQLLDSVMQLLDYEYATGEDLREMEYIPDDGSAAAAAETAAADLEMAAANAAAAALAAEAEAEAAALAAAAASAGGGGGGAKAGAGAGAGGSDGYGDVHSDFDEADWEAKETGYADDYNADQIAREVVEESSSSASSSSSSSSSCAIGEVERGGARGEVADLEFDESTLLGYAHNLATEVLRTMRRDMNYLVGLLPAPVAKPIREAAAFVGDTASRFVTPALRQAERYTRGLRRGAGKAAGKAALALKDNVLPSVGRGAKAAASKAKRRVGDAIAARRAKREGDGGEQQQQ